MEMHEKQFIINSKKVYGIYCAYYNDMNDGQKAEFQKQAFIPDGVGLELEHFEEFYEKRKEILTAKL